MYYSITTRTFFTHAEVNIVVEIQQFKKKRSFWDNNQQKLISQLLLNSSYLEIVKTLASYFSVSKGIIYRNWRQTKETGDACHKKTKNCG